MEMWVETIDIFSISLFNFVFSHVHMCICMSRVGGVAEESSGIRSTGTGCLRAVRNPLIHILAIALGSSGRLMCILTTKPSLQSPHSMHV